MLRLYYAAHTCALASHIALEEVDAAYDTVRLDIDAGEQRSPAYLAINPKGRVPTLVTQRGTLTETPAILRFHRAEPSRVAARAAHRRLRLRARPGVQQLSLRDPPCGACAPHARLSLGR